MLSKRLQAVADMVTKGNRIADIGTDHGYVPIYLTKNHICPSAYAMDIHEGPLKIAEKNIQKEGLSDKIITIRSDGMEQLAPGMAESVVIAGMGGELIIDILKKRESVKGIREFILAPHRRVDLVRKYVISRGWSIAAENMVLDAGKFYPILRVVLAKKAEPEYREEELRYGRILLQEKNAVLKEYLEKEYVKFSEILNTMKESENCSIQPIEEILELNRKGRTFYDSGRN